MLQCRCRREEKLVEVDLVRFVVVVRKEGQTYPPTIIQEAHAN